VTRRQGGGSASESVAPPPFVHPMLGIAGWAKGRGGLHRTHRILAKMLRQGGNSEVTNKHCGIRFVFLVIANT